MKAYSALPRELVDLSVEVDPEQMLPPQQVVDFHYHDVEEWLTIVHGEITFFTLADTPYRLEVGRTLHIPRGEVYRAEAGPEGGRYRMFLPVQVSSFRNELTTRELDALRLNLEFPEYEDGRAGGGCEFFENALSNQLVFCRVDGTCVDKRTFIKNAFVDKGRSSAGTVQVLNRTENGLLISTIVEMTDAKGAHSFVNVRFLAAEGGILRCRLWVNYPRPIQALATTNGEDGTVGDTAARGA